MSDRVFKQFGNLILPGRYQVPTGKLRVDGTHPLARGLTACFLPGNSLTDLSNENITLIKPADSGLYPRLGPDGLGLYLAGTNDIKGLATPSQKLVAIAAEGMSWFARFYQVAVSANYSAPFFCSYSEPNVNPYITWAFQAASDSSTWCASRGSSVGPALVTQAANTMLSLGACLHDGSKFESGNTTQGYVNGVSVFNNSGNFPIDPANQSATSQITLSGNANVIIFCAYLWNRHLFAHEMAQLYADPYGFIVPADFDTPLFRVALFLQPDADDADGSWTNELGSNTNLFASIDESSANDADYIQSSLTPVNDVVRLRLSDPAGGVAEPVNVSYRYQKVGSATIDLIVNLKEGTTTRASWTHSNISSSLVTATQTLSTGQVTSIGDWTNLYIEFAANAP